MPKRDPQIDAHREWIGFVRPTGLVVSAPALVRAGAVLPRDPEGQRRLRACVAERRFRPDGKPEPWLPDFRAFAASVLDWSFSPKGYAGTDASPIPPELERPLQEGGEVLRPDFAVRERDPRDDGSRWQLVGEAIEPGDDFDRVAGGAGRLEVSAHGRMERLLRQTGVPAGLLSNGRTLRLVSAPRGESCHDCKERSTETQGQESPEPGLRPGFHSDALKEPPAYRDAFGLSVDAPLG